MSQNLKAVTDAPMVDSPQIYSLMSKIMHDVGFIAKGRQNTQQNYAFRGIDDVFAALQPALISHGVFFVPEVIQSEQVERASRSGGLLIYTTLRVAYTFYAPDGSSVGAVVVGEAMDSGDKSANKAMSAALKYAVLQIFCVPTEATPDADSDSPDPAPRAKQATTPAPVKPRPAASKPQTNGLATEAQNRAIGNLSKSIDNVTLLGIMNDCGCVNQSELTEEQAKEVIKRLQDEPVF